VRAPAVVAVAALIATGCWKRDAETSSPTTRPEAAAARPDDAAPGAPRD
jgi:hypothetical protein